MFPIGFLTVPAKPPTKFEAAGLPPKPDSHGIVSLGKDEPLPSHGENRGSSPLGSANKIKHLKQ
jgi:hypothetical protein